MKAYTATLTRLNQHTLTVNHVQWVSNHIWTYLCATLHSMILFIKWTKICSTT